MAKKNESKCLGCGDSFESDVRNRGRQKYCPKSECRAAGKAARQRRWLAKPENRYYFKDPENTARVKAWQRAHPGYWRNTARHRRRTLQDALHTQVVDRAGDVAALQDALRLQGPVLIGLIAHLSPSALQDDIAATSRRLLQRGQQILAGTHPDAAKTTAAP